VKMEKCSKKACIKNEKGDNGDIYKWFKQYNWYLTWI
jgi:hypothetical protein